MGGFHSAQHRFFLHDCILLIVFAKTFRSHLRQKRLARANFSKIVNIFLLFQTAAGMTVLCSLTPMQLNIVIIAKSRGHFGQFEQWLKNIPHVRRIVVLNSRREPCRN